MSKVKDLQVGLSLFVHQYRRSNYWPPYLQKASIFLRGIIYYAIDIHVYIYGGMYLDFKMIQYRWQVKYVLYCTNTYVLRV